MEAVKRCSRCGEIKTVSQFTKTTGSKDGLYSQCRDCQKQVRIEKKNGDAPTQQCKPDQKLILTNAIATFGKEHQLKKIVEECAEYIKAWHDWTEGRPGAWTALISELADLFVTGWQGRLIVGPKELDVEIDSKLFKLADEIAAKKAKQKENTIENT